MPIHKLSLDNRAQHKVWSNGCVKLPYRDHVISIASDGGDVILENSYGKTIDRVSLSDYGLVEAIVQLKQTVDDLKGVKA